MTTDLFGGVLLVAAVTYDDVRALTSEARHDALETTFFAWINKKKETNRNRLLTRRHAKWHVFICETLANAC